MSDGHLQRGLKIHPTQKKAVSAQQATAPSGLANWFGPTWAGSVTFSGKGSSVSVFQHQVTIKSILSLERLHSHLCANIDDQ